MYLQYGLHILTFSSNGFDGVFGMRTLIAVKSFQSKYNIAVDGVVGDNTWSKLTSEIKSIQTKLNNKGFNIGTVDGIAGPKTYNAVIAFQKANNLAADGMVGPATNAALSKDSGTNPNPTPTPTPDPNRNIKKVFIDPGHGGTDPGALGNGLRESDITLAISKKLGDILKAKGIEVKFSRTTDVFISLAERPRQANAWGADIFVSIHCNSASASATGTECFTYPTASSVAKSLSKNVASSVASNLSLTNRGHKEANFAVLRISSMPAILVETAFITNASDSDKLKNRQDDFADAIASQILAL